MKTIEKAATEQAYNFVHGNVEYSHPNFVANEKNQSFEDGVAFAEEWISVDDEIPECNLIDEEGIRYSDCILIKSNNLEFPVTGVYIIANDDEFFETFSKFDVLQNDITHWRPLNRE